MASFSFNNAKNEKEDQSTKLPADIADLDISTEVTDGRTVGQGFTEAVNPNSVASAFARQLTSVDQAREIYTDVLPKGYQRSLNTFDKFKSTIESNARYAQKQLAGPIKEVKRLVARNVDKVDGKLPKGIVNRLKEWSKEKPSYTGVSEEEQREASIANELNAIFGAQKAVTDRNRSEDLIRDEIKDKKSDEKHKEITDIGSKSHGLLERLVNYQDTITMNYQRKSLELQMRQYQAMVVSIDSSKKANDLIVTNLAQIATNTSLPDYVKLHASERAMELLRTNMFNKASSKMGSVLKNAPLINGIMQTMRNRAKNRVDDLKNSFEDGLSSIELLESMASTIASSEMTKGQLGEMAGGMAADYAGETIANKAAKWAGKKVKKFVDKNKTIQKVGRASEYLHDTPSAIFDVLINDVIPSFKDKEGDRLVDKDGVRGKILKSISEFLEETANASVGSGNKTMQVTELNAYSEHASLSKAALVSIEEIIPGWLQRISHNTAILATGNPELPVTHYVFGKGFVKDGDYTKSIRELLFDDSSKSSLNYQRESLGKLLDSGENKLDPKTKEKLLDVLLKDNIANKNRFNQKDIADYSKITDGNNWFRDGISEEEANSIAKIMSEVIGEKYSQKHVNFNRELDRFGTSVIDKREVVQDLITSGNYQLMRGLGIIDENNAFDPEVYIKLLNQEKIAFNFDDTIVRGDSVKSSHFVYKNKDGKYDDQPPTESGTNPNVPPSPPSPVAPPHTPNDPSVQSFGDIQVNLGNRATRTIVEAIGKNTDRSIKVLEVIVERLEEIRDKDATSYHFEVGLSNGIKTGYRLARKGIKNIFKTAKPLFDLGNKGFKHALKIPKYAATAGEWAASKMDSLKDIYLAGYNSPVIQEYKLKAGMYRDMVTGEIIKNYKDIKNGVIDENGNCVLTKEQIKNAFVRSKFGKRSIESLGAGKDKLKEWADKSPLVGTAMLGARSLWRNVLTAKDNVANLLEAQFDVMMPNEEVPRLTAHKLRLGQYYLGTSKKVIYTLNEITEDVYEGEELRLTVEEASRAYYRAPFGRRLLSTLTGSLKRAKNFLLGNQTFGQRVESAYNRILDLVDSPMDIYVKGDLINPRLLGVTMEAGGYRCEVTKQLVTRPSLIKGPVRRIHDEMLVLTESDIARGLVDYKGMPIKSIRANIFDKLKTAGSYGLKLVKKGWETLKTGLSKVADMLGSEKGVNLSWLADWWTKNPVVDQLKLIYTLLDDRLPTKKKKKRKGGFTDRNGEDRLIGDQDNDGDVDGSNKDLEQQAAETEPAGPTGTPNRLGNFWNKVKGIAAKRFGPGTAAAGAAGAGAGAAAGAAAGGTPTPANPNGQNNGESDGPSGTDIAAGAAAGAAGASILGSVLGGTKKAAFWAAKKTGKLAWWGIKNTINPLGKGTLTRGALNLGLRAGFHVVTKIPLLFTPVGLGVAAVAGLSYMAYSYATRFKEGAKTYLRMAQYGFTTAYREKFKGIAELEGMLESLVTYKDGVATLDSTKTDEEMNAKVRDIFGINEENPKHPAKFKEWYVKRFKPVYLAHLTALKKLGVSTKLIDIESLSAEKSLAYVQAVRNLKIDFLEIQSPFPDVPHLDATARDIQEFAEKAIRDAKREKPDAATPAVGGANATEIAKGVVGTTVAATAMQNANKTASLDEALANQKSPYADTSKNAVLNTGTAGAVVVISPMAKIAFDKENLKIGALDAVRFKTYGAMDLDNTRLSSLRSAEKIALDYLSVGDEKRVIFKGDILKFCDAISGYFGINTDDLTGSTSLIRWVRERFLPTYLNYVSSLNVVYGKYDEKVSQNLSPDVAYRIAVYVRDSKNYDNEPVWNFKDSPWPNYTLNCDITSVIANIEFLKEKMGAGKKIAEERISETAEKGKQAEIKTKGDAHTSNVKQMSSSKPDPLKAPSALDRMVEGASTMYGEANYYTNRIVDKTKDILGMGPSKSATAGTATSALGIQVAPTNTPSKITGNEDLATLIHMGESRRRGYNDYNRGSDGRAASNKANIDLTNMTIGDIMRYQSYPIGHPERLFAVGKYQVIPNTMRDAVSSLGISLNEKFTPQLQERIFVEFLATKRKNRYDLEKYIRGKGDNLGGAVNSLAYEWASLQKMDGRGHYDGKGNNKAHIPVSAIKVAVEKARERYAQLIKDGVPADKAYGIALGAYASNGMAKTTTATSATTTPAPVGGTGQPTLPNQANAAGVKTPGAMPNNNAPTGATPNMVGGAPAGGTMPTSYGGQTPPLASAAAGDLLPGNAGWNGIAAGAEKLKGINPEYLKLALGAIEEYNKATGKKVTITGGIRSTQKQAELYAKDPSKAAKPGNSPHEFGLAFDADPATLNEMEKMGILRKYGLTRPIGGEPWHAEPAGIQSDLKGAKSSPAKAAELIKASPGKGGGGLGTVPGAPLKSRATAPNSPNSSGAGLVKVAGSDKPVPTGAAANTMVPPGTKPTASAMATAQSVSPVKTSAATISKVQSGPINAANDPVREETKKKVFEQQQANAPEWLQKAIAKEDPSLSYEEKLRRVNTKLESGLIPSDIKQDDSFLKQRRSEVNKLRKEADLAVQNTTATAPKAMPVKTLVEQPTLLGSPDKSVVVKDTVPKPVLPANEPKLTSSAMAMNRILNGKNIEDSLTKPTNTMDYVDGLSKVSHGFTQQGTVTHKRVMENKVDTTNKATLESTSLVVEEIRKSNSILTEIRDLIAKRPVSGNVNADAVQKVNDTEANRTQQFRETAFKRVSRGSAKSELPVNLSSSGLI